MHVLNSILTVFGGADHSTIYRYRSMETYDGFQWNLLNTTLNNDHYFSASVLVPDIPCNQTRCYLIYTYIYFCCLCACMLSISVGTAGPIGSTFFQITPGYPDQIIDQSQTRKKSKNKNKIMHDKYIANPAKVLYIVYPSIYAQIHRESQKLYVQMYIGSPKNHKTCVMPYTYNKINRRLFNFENLLNLLFFLIPMKETFA